MKQPSRSNDLHCAVVSYIESPDKEKANNVIEASKPLLIPIISRYPRKLQDDLLQDCYVLLFKLMERYKSDRGSFSTYYIKSVKFLLNDMLLEYESLGTGKAFSIRQYAKSKPVKVRIDEFDDVDVGKEETPLIDIKIDLDTICNDNPLTMLIKDLVIHRGKTIKEIASMLGIEYRRVWRIIKKIRRQKHC